jgi:hypothetical protein
VTHADHSAAGRRRQDDRANLANRFPVSVGENERFQELVGFDSDPVEPVLWCAALRELEVRVDLGNPATRMATARSSARRTVRWSR